VLPSVVEAGAHPAGVGAAAAAITLGVGLTVWNRQRGLTTRQRGQAAVVLATVAVLGLAVVLLTDPSRAPDAFLVVAASLVVALASVPVVRLRWLFLSALLGAVALAAVRAAWPIEQIVYVVGTFVLLGILGDIFSRELRLARHAQVLARRDADRRAELLGAVADLPERSPESAARACVEAMLDLAYDAAGVTVRREDGYLHAVYVDGTGVIVTPQAPGEGMAWVAMREDRTITSVDYNREAYALPGRDAVRTAVVTPIRVSGQPAGVLVGARRRSRQPTAGELEIAEVLAVHLGAVFEADRRATPQQELLARVAELDRMRRGFVGAVSAEVRDPITIIRGIARILLVHGTELDEDRRLEFLESLTEQAAELGRIIDTLLDFSRFRVASGEAMAEAITVRRLLAPLLELDGVSLRGGELAMLGDLEVLVEPGLLGAAVELLIGGAAPHASVELVVDATEDHVVLQLHRQASEVSALLRSLAEQLAVGAGAEAIDGVEGVRMVRLHRGERSSPATTGGRG
jgi:K+-sensing histidine kinase KdpD